jgi:hypothetical protein
MMMKQELLLRRLFTGAFSLFLVVSHLTPTALACSCNGPVTIQSSLANSETAVFTTVLEKLPSPTDQFSSQYYRADADGVLKGCGLIRDTIFYIKTAANSGLCGVDFLQPNVRYILFGTISYQPITGFVSTAQPVLTIDLCKAQSVLSNLERTTQTFLYNQPTPVCNRPPPVAVPVPAPVSAPTIPASAQSVNCQVCPTGFYDGCNTCGCREGFTTFCSFQTCSTYRTATCSNVSGGTAPVPRPIPVPVNVPVQPRPVTAPMTAPVPTPTLAGTGRLTCGTCPSGYYDGCNTCTCDQSGRATCTGFTCRTLGQPACRLPWPPLPASPVAPRPSPVAPVRPPPTNPPPTPTVVQVRPASVSCAACRTTSFYDGCNTCSCTNNGGRSCTRRVCATYTTAFCNNVAAAPVVTPIPPTPPTNPPPSPTTAATTVNCRTCPRGYADDCNTCGCSNTGAAFCSQRYCAVRGTWRCM